jgi:aryl-alcohol dehydrogenase-like predicted oxidoreductase
MSPPLPTRKIGSTNVTAVGYGGMGISVAYGAAKSDEERLAVRRASTRFPSHRAHLRSQFLDTLYETGCTNWDSADIYGDCEDLLGKWSASVVCRCNYQTC